MFHKTFARFSIEHEIEHEMNSATGRGLGLA